MRIVMITIGSTGDVKPYVSLGKELKSSGHEITIAAFENFEGMATEAGLGFFPLAGDAREMMTRIMSPKAKGPNYLVEFNKAINGIAPILLNDILECCRNQDAMVCTFFGSAFYSVAEKYDIPCIQTQYFPMDPNRIMPMSSAPGQHLGKAWNRTTYRAGYLLIGMLEKHYLTDWREENGMKPRKMRSAPDYRVNGHRVPVIYAASPMVMRRPSNWDEHIHMSGYWFDEEPEPYTPPENLEEFLAAGEQPIYIGFGSMNSGDMRKTFTKVLRAVRAAHVRAVFNCGWSGEDIAAGSSGRLYFAEAVPHEWLFPRVKAVVHHGGSGTTAAGLLAGKPTLIIPFGGDQPFWGSKVYDLGCGPKPISRSNPSVEKLTKALIDLTTKERYRLAAEEVSHYLANEHGLVRAADIIEDEIAHWREEQ